MTETTTNLTKFVILGGVGKISKYHFEAIEKVGGEVVAVIDPKVTTYFDKKWYKSIEEYDQDVPSPYPEYCVICTPNHLHTEQAAQMLKYGDVICEKPVALSIRELDWLISEESLGETKVHPIMQMRYHPILPHLREQFQTIPPNSKEDENPISSKTGNRTTTLGSVTSFDMLSGTRLVRAFHE